MGFGVLIKFNLVERKERRKKEEEKEKKKKGKD